VAQAILAFTRHVHFNIDRGVARNSQLKSLNLGRWLTITASDCKDGKA
jgi:hypothetical protein